ncbi:hypothetical protein F5Y09DRAFT_55397 [Xylaria sp. FL1042]|nr:hypothetical protein F5Y09DRAFT_55397 [Xylaria sp. FL1042]
MHRATRFGPRSVCLSGCLAAPPSFQVLMYACKHIPVFVCCVPISPDNYRNCLVVIGHGYIVCHCAGIFRHQLSSDRGFAPAKDSCGPPELTGWLLANLLRGTLAPSHSHICSLAPRSGGSRRLLRMNLMRFCWSQQILHHILYTR